jgi:PAS domain S-box-containing protein
MIYPFFLAVTVLIFLCTAAAALRVIAYSQAPLAWFLVISGLLLMACMGVVGTVTYSSYPPQPITQLSILVGLLVSILWLIAILMLVPILLTRKRSDETFKLIITDSLQGLVIYQSGHIVFSNLAFAQLAGTTVEDLLMYSDTDIEALFKSEEGENPLAYFRGFPDNISEIHQDVRLIPRNGGVVWVEMFLRPALYLGKKSVQAIFIPLTDRRLNQQSLYESEQRHRLISSMISDYVYSSHVNPDGSTYTEWISGSFERITGRAVTQLKAVHTDWLSLIYSEDHPIFLTAYHSAIQTGDAIAEYRIFTPQGRAVWLR